MANKTVTVRPSGGDYTTLQGAITGELGANANLVTMAGILHIEIGGTWSSADTAAATVDGFTTNASYYVHIYTATAARHLGIPSSSYYQISVSSGSALTISDNYTRVEGLQAVTSSSGTVGAFHVTDSTTNVRIGYCLGSATASGSAGGSFLAYGDNNSTTFYNCLGYDSATNGFRVSGTTYLYNCTAVDNATGFSSYYSVASTWTNCLGYSNSTADFAETGTNPTVTYCASSDATADDWGGSGNIISQTFSFVNDGGNDWHLGAADAPGVGDGTDDPSSGIYSDDVDGQSRTSPWDIGFDEYVAAAANNVVMNII
jgi:hypothetical protein